MLSAQAPSKAGSDLCALGLLLPPPPDNLSYIEHIFEISRRPDLLTMVVEYRTQVLKISEEDEVDTKLTRIPSAKKYKGRCPPPPPPLRPAWWAPCLCWGRPRVWCPPPPGWGWSAKPEGREGPGRQAPPKRALWGARGPDLPPPRRSHW